MDVVKLDIEGGEYAALAGMEGAIRRLGPRAIIVEVGDHRLRQAGTSAAMLDDLLASFGYGRTGQVFLENVVYRPR
jgi:hypothetical protein